MQIKKEIIDKKYCCKFVALDSGREVGRAFVYFIYNDLHKEPYALLEDVFVDEKYRQKGLGRELVEKVIKEAKNKKCYKIIGSSRKSRDSVHKFYEKIGFENYGVEFRINL